MHIHLKVHLGGTETFTGQLFFEDEQTAEVYEADPYAARGTPDVLNESDAIYGQSEAGRSSRSPRRARAEARVTLGGARVAPSLAVSAHQFTGLASGPTMWPCEPGGSAAMSCEK